MRKKWFAHLKEFLWIVYRILWWNTYWDEQCNAQQPRVNQQHHRTASTIPPPVVVLVPVDIPIVSLQVQHHTQSAPVLLIYHLQCSFPSEIFVILGIVLVQFVEIERQVTWTVEVVDVDVRSSWNTGCVVFLSSTHHDRKNIVAGRIK